MNVRDHSSSTKPHNNPDGRSIMDRDENGEMLVNSLSFQNCGDDQIIVMTTVTLILMIVHHRNQKKNFNQYDPPPHHHRHQ